MKKSALVKLIKETINEESSQLDKLKQALVGKTITDVNIEGFDDCIITLDNGKVITLHGEVENLIQ